MQIYLKLFSFLFCSMLMLLRGDVNEEMDQMMSCWRQSCNKVSKDDFNSFYNQASNHCNHQELEERILTGNWKNNINDTKLLALVECCSCFFGAPSLYPSKRTADEKEESESNRGQSGLFHKSKQLKLLPIKTHSTPTQSEQYFDSRFGSESDSSHKRVLRSIHPNKRPDLESPAPDLDLRRSPGKRSSVPMFENRTYHATINENSPPATPVCLLRATMVDSKTKMKAMFTSGDGDDDFARDDEVAKNDGDDDAGTDKKDVIRYRLENDEYDSFAVDSKTGLITVKDPRKLDYETTPRSKVVVIAESGLSCDFAVLWVHLKDVNDNSPQFTREKYFSAVYEDTHKGSYVTQISAEDKDSGLNARLVYRIVSGNVNQAFSIDPPNTGIVKTNAILDREERDFYRLEVEALDQGRVQRSGSAVLRIQVVDVNDNRPMFEDIKDVLVNEALEVNSVIYQLMATDKDLNTTFAFSIVNQTNHPSFDWLSSKNQPANKKSPQRQGSQSSWDNGIDHDAYFDVEKSSGKIRSIKKLDREQFERHVLTIQVSDGLLSSVGVLHISVQDVNDNPPIFSSQIYEVSVLELTPEDVKVMSVEARDGDVGTNSLITYELVGPDLFRIDSDTGCIYTNRVVTLNKGQHDLVIEAVVKATDGGVPSLSSMISVRFRLVDVDDHPPIFGSDSYELEIPEDEKIGLRPILKLSASDDDPDEKNNGLFYRICPTRNADDPSGDDDRSFFSVNSSTGELFLVKSLDRETKDFLQLIVMVSNTNEKDGDHGGCQEQAEKPSRPKNDSETEKFVSLQTAKGTFRFSKSSVNSFALVNITVTDVNDNAPVFSRDVYRTTLPEDSLVDVSVARLSTSDADVGQKVAYSVVGGNEENAFRLDSDTGLLTLKMKLDYETRTQYILTVEAKDVGFPPLSSHCSVEIGVTDVNEFRPIFTNILYIGSLREGTPTDFLVFTALAIDRDAGLYGMVHYRMSCLAEDSSCPDLGINPVSGQVKTRSLTTLPLDGRASFNYLIVAEDAGGLNATVNAVVTVEPLPFSSSKQRVRFENSSYHFCLPGNSLSGSVVGRVFVVQSGISGQDDLSLIKYHFLQDNDFFSINSSSGEIFLRVDLNSVSVSELSAHYKGFDEYHIDDDVVGKKGKRHFPYASKIAAYGTSHKKNRGLEASHAKELRKRSAIGSSPLESVRLTVVAEWDLPEKGRISTTLKIDVDRSCDGCSLESVVGKMREGFLSRNHVLTLVAFFLGILFVMATIAVVTMMRKRRNAKPIKSEAVRVESDRATNRCSSVNTTLGIPSPPPFLGGRNLRAAVSNRHQAAPCPVLRLSRTDEEVRLINNGLTQPSGHQPIMDSEEDGDMDGRELIQDISRACWGSCDENESFMHEDECITSHARPSPAKPQIESETLKLLGNVQESFLAKKLSLSPTSMESIHLFSEEGGGESGWIGTSATKDKFLPQSGNPVGVIKPRDYFLPKWLTNAEALNNNNNNNGINIQNLNCMNSADHPLPTKVFQLLDHLPDFHALSDVYKEISRLRDDRVVVSVPKTKPTKIVVGTGEDQRVENQPRFYPPPILTDVPPPCWVHRREPRVTLSQGRRACLDLTKLS